MKNKKNSERKAVATVRVQRPCDGTHSLHLVRALIRNTERHRALLKQMHDESLCLNKRDKLKARMDALFDTLEILSVSERQLRPKDD